MPETNDQTRIFLCGDVMTGRGIDQILPHPSDPQIYESSLKSAVGYVELAERVSGSIPHPVSFSYIWGDSLQILEEMDPGFRIINLETAITSSLDYWPDKGINYKMSPANAACLTVAGIDFCALANNHVLDWGYSGLEETLETLEESEIAHAGAGRNASEAREPAVLERKEGGRLLIFSLGMGSSGIPDEWEADADQPGVFRVNILSETKALEEIKRRLEKVKRPGDIAVVSIHWGSNWGYSVPSRQRYFAYSLIDEAGIDLIHGHSSHHPRGIEVYQNRLILYGCGDFVNDYEGIRGHEEYRSELSLMYFPELQTSTGKLTRLQMIPTRIKRFQVNRASLEETKWLRELLSRTGKPLRTDVKLQQAGYLSLEWQD